MGYVTDNADHEADEAGTGGVGSIGFRHSATMHEMVMVVLLSADSLRVKSICENSDIQKTNIEKFSLRKFLPKKNFERVFMRKA